MSVLLKDAGTRGTQTEGVDVGAGRFGLDGILRECGCSPGMILIRINSCYCLV